jgi:hypothetical protein
MRLTCTAQITTVVESEEILVQLPGSNEERIRLDQILRQKR